jgi:hypothetical protein
MSTWGGTKAGQVQFKYFSTLTPPTLLTKLGVLKTKGMGNALW